MLCQLWPRRIAKYVHIGIWDRLAQYAGGSSKTSHNASVDVVRVQEIYPLDPLLGHHVIDPGLRLYRKYALDTFEDQVSIFERLF